MKRLAAILALSLGVAAAGFAAPRGPHYGYGMGAMEADGMGPMFHHYGFLSRLHDEFQLNARQEALWKEASDFLHNQRLGMRERFDKERVEIRAMLDQPNVDLRAVAKRMDALRTEGQKERDAVRERWFAVYDALDAGQKEKALAFFRDGMRRFDGSSGYRGGRGHGGYGPRYAPAPDRTPAP